MRVYESLCGGIDPSPRYPSAKTSKSGSRMRHYLAPAEIDKPLQTLKGMVEVNGRCIEGDTMTSSPWSSSLTAWAGAAYLPPVLRGAQRRLWTTQAHRGAQSGPAWPGQTRTGDGPYHSTANRHGEYRWNGNLARAIALGCRRSGGGHKRHRGGTYGCLVQQADGNYCQWS